MATRLCMFAVVCVCVLVRASWCECVCLRLRVYIRMCDLVCRENGVTIDESTEKELRVKVNVHVDAFNAYTSASTVNDVVHRQRHVRV